MKMMSMEKRRWTLVSQSEQLDGLAGPLLVCGDAMFASCREIALEGFTRIRARHGNGGWRAWFGGGGAQLHLALEEGFLQRCNAQHHLGFALDGYLRWGLRSKGDVVLLGGIEGEQHTSVDLLYFRQGRLLDYESKLLPPREAGHFEAVLSALVEDFAQKAPATRIVIAAPLSKPERLPVSFDYLGPEIFRSIMFRPVSAHLRAQLRPGMLVAGALAISGLAAVGAVAHGLLLYDASIKDFEREANDPMIQRNGGMDTGLLEVIQQRQAYLAAPHLQSNMIQTLRSVMVALERLPGVRIVEARLMSGRASARQTPSAGNPVATRRAPDITLRIAVAQDGGSAMTQAKSLLEAMAVSTGMEVRLTRQGWVDEGARRVLTVEGFRHE